MTLATWCRVNALIVDVVERAGRFDALAYEYPRARSASCGGCLQAALNTLPCQSLFERPPRLRRSVTMPWLNKTRALALAKDLASLDSAIRMLESAKLIVAVVPVFGSSLKEFVEIGIEVCRTTQVRRILAPFDRCVTHTYDRKSSPTNRTRLNWRCTQPCARHLWSGRASFSVSTYLTRKRR
jgi:hypothetical protein